MKRRSIVSIVSSVAIIGLGVFYYSQHSEDFHLLTTLSVQSIIGLSVVQIALAFCHGWQLKILTDIYNLNLSFSQWFGLSRITAFSRLLFPFPAGASLKALYLKRMHHFKYKSFVVSTAVTSFITLIVASSFALVLLLPSWREGLFLLVVAGSVFIGATAFLLFGHMIRNHNVSSLGTLCDLAKELATIRGNYKAMAKLSVLNCSVFVISTLGVHCSFMAFSIKASLVSSGVICAFSILTATLNLMPANLGIQEAVFVIISAMYSIGINEGLHAAALSRIVGTVFILLLAPGFAYQFSEEVIRQKSDAQD